MVAKKKAANKKPAAKRKGVAKKKPIARKKRAGKKMAATMRPAPLSKGSSANRHPGFVSSSSGLFLPPYLATPVPPKKIRTGLSKARGEIGKLMEELSDLTEDFNLAQLQLTASFSADGKFLGIGVGGATSISITFKPKNA